MVPYALYAPLYRTDSKSIHRHSQGRAPPPQLIQNAYDSECRLSIASSKDDSTSTVVYHLSGSSQTNNANQLAVYAELQSVPQDLIPAQSFRSKRFCRRTAIEMNHVEVVCKFRSASQWCSLCFGVVFSFLLMLRVVSDFLPMLQRYLVPPCS